MFGLTRLGRELLDKRGAMEDGDSSFGGGSFFSSGDSGGFGSLGSGTYGMGSLGSLGSNVSSWGGGWTSPSYSSSGGSSWGTSGRGSSGNTYGSPSVGAFFGETPAKSIGPTPATPAATPSAPETPAAPAWSSSPVDPFWGAQAGPTLAQAGLTPYAGTPTSALSLGQPSPSGPAPTEQPVTTAQPTAPGEKPQSNWLASLLNVEPATAAKLTGLAKILGTFISPYAGIAIGGANLLGQILTGQGSASYTGQPGSGSALTPGNVISTLGAAVPGGAGVASAAGGLMNLAGVGFNAPGAPTGGSVGGGGAGYSFPFAGYGNTSGYTSSPLMSRQIARAGEQAAEVANPFGSSRQQYIDQLNALQANPSSIVNTPGYNAGLTAVQRSLAAQGFTGSGRAMVDLAKYGGDFYNQQVNMLAGLAGAGISPAQGAQIAYQSAVDSKQTEQQTINAISSALALLGG